MSLNCLGWAHSVTAALYFIAVLGLLSNARVTSPASVFRVFAVAAPVSLPVCRQVCARWRSDAYVATILTAVENAQVAAQLSGTGQVLLGGQRDSASSPFRWTDWVHLWNPSLPWVQ